MPPYSLLSPAKRLWRALNQPKRLAKRLSSAPKPLKRLSSAPKPLKRLSSAPKPLKRPSSAPKPLKRPSLPPKPSRKHPRQSSRSPNRSKKLWCLSNPSPNRLRNSSHPPSRRSNKPPKRQIPLVLRRAPVRPAIPPVRLSRKHQAGWSSRFPRALAQAALEDHPLDQAQALSLL